MQRACYTHAHGAPPIARDLDVNARAVGKGIAPRCGPRIERRRTLRSETFKKYLLGSMSLVAGCAFMTLVVTAAVFGVVGGLIQGDDDVERLETDARPS